MPPLRPTLLRSPPRHHASHLGSRFFSSTPTSFARPSASQLEFIHRSIAPYPYGASLTYKQSNFGLYGGSHIQFGNTVSEHNNKSRRTWKPNVHRKRLWSNSLQRFVRIRVLARVLRTIDKVGGLDEYLLGDKPARVKELGMAGWALRSKLMQHPNVQKRFEEEKRRLGIPSESEKELAALAEAQKLAEAREEAREAARKARKKVKRKALKARKQAARAARIPRAVMPVSDAKPDGVGVTGKMKLVAKRAARELLRIAGRRERKGE